MLEVLLFVFAGFFLYFFFLPPAPPPPPRTHTLAPFFLEINVSISLNIKTCCLFAPRLLLYTPRQVLKQLDAHRRLLGCHNTCHNRNIVL